MECEAVIHSFHPTGYAHGLGETFALECCKHGLITERKGVRSSLNPEIIRRELAHAWEEHLAAHADDQETLPVHLL